MKRGGIAAAILLGLTIAGAATLWPPLHASFRTRLIGALEEHFKADVQLAALDVSFIPRVTATGRGLVIRTRSGPASSPLVSIESFQADGRLADLARRALRLRRVSLKGLKLHIPPKRLRDGAGVSVGKITRSALIIDELISDEGDLIIDTDKPGGSPLLFHIHRFHLRDFAFDRSTAFDATLINPVPPGEVKTQGQFGPWVPDEPRLTPLSGSYELERADLSVFEGLAGRLSSRGTFDGRLEQLAVKGRTATPDFVLTKTGQPVPLDTAFDAVVDGTNGDTVLNQVSATLLRSTIVAEGRVIKVDKGRLIEMAVRVDDGRLEDVMRLALKHEPPMAGLLGLRTMMALAPGKGEVIERLGLEGRFSVRSGQFASSDVQHRLGDLSRRGRGEPEAPISDRVFSDLTGSFLLRDGVLDLPGVTFSVDGATVNLGGAYAVREESLNFAGTLRLQAKPSETVTGFKSFLLKTVDPLFRSGNAGTELPIRVQGTVEQPRFGVNVRQALFGR